MDSQPLRGIAFRVPGPDGVILGAAVGTQLDPPGGSPIGGVAALVERLGLQ